MTGPVEQHLRDVMWYLADPKVKWVPRPPGADQDCLVTAQSRLAGHDDFDDWLYQWCMTTEGVDRSRVNDGFRSRDELIWWLEEVVDQAAAEGV